MLDPTTDAADTPTPLKERAWALYCQGHHSPAIGEQLGVPERTVRSWINRITADLDTHHGEQREHHLLLAIERKRHISIAAWDGYERAIQLAEGERAHAVAAHDEEISTACVRASRHSLIAAVRFLKVLAANDRDLTALTTLHDDQRRQQDLDAAEQDRQARDQERDQERERARRAREQERFEREQDRLDRQRERESEPQPPEWFTPTDLDQQEALSPSARRPEVNAYFAARDIYHAARQATEDYTRVREAAALREERAVNRAAERSFLLSALSQADVADLLARLDAEEAAEATAAAAADQLSAPDQHERGSLPTAGGRPGEGTNTEIAAKTATSGSPSPRRGGGWGERSHHLPITQPADRTIPASLLATEDEDDQDETEYAAKTATASLAPRYEEVVGPTPCS